MSGDRPRIAVVAGPTATILNSPPLVTGGLRPQRLAAPVTVYVEQFSAHPLEADARELYGPPDGYVDVDGVFSEVQRSAEDTPVYAITLDPADGLQLLPYAARTADGSAWEGDGVQPAADRAHSRQPFYPDASRLFEEIDRFGVGPRGESGLLASRADFDFWRVCPPGGYTKGGETPGEDFFPYRPYHLTRQPRLGDLARIANDVSRILASHSYTGCLWLEGSPHLEETLYWLSLLVDTTVPIAGCAAQRTHGMVSEDGSRNIIDAVDYVRSRVWADDDGRNRVGVVAVMDQRILSSREVQKVDGRTGGFDVTGGTGGVLGIVSDALGPKLDFLPTRRHTHTSAVRLSELPPETKDEQGLLRADAIPRVEIVKGGGYAGAFDADAVVDALRGGVELFGIVGEGSTPFGRLGGAMETALVRAAFSGVPVVKVGRGAPAGRAALSVSPFPFIAGGNLTATKARLLLIACLLRFGALPQPADAARPTDAERSELAAALAHYQDVFDTH